MLLLLVIEEGLKLTDNPLGLGDALLESKNEGFHCVGCDARRGYCHGLFEPYGSTPPSNRTAKEELLRSFVLF